MMYRYVYECDVIYDGCTQVCLTAHEGWKNIRCSTHYALPCPFESRFHANPRAELVIGWQGALVILSSTMLRLEACMGMLNILHRC